MFNKFLVVVFFIGIFFVVQVVIVDLCYEYIDSGVNVDCVLVLYCFVNGVGFFVEVKWKLGGDKVDQLFVDVVGNGYED